MRTDQGLTRTEVKPRWRMDYFYLARATDPQHAKAVLNCLDFQSGAVFAAMVVKGGDPYALAVAPEAIKFTGRTRLIIMSDQENAVKNPRGHDQGQQNARNCCDQHTEGIECTCTEIERASYEVEKQIRTLRSRFEENYWESVNWTTRCCHFWCGTVRG